MPDEPTTTHAPEDYGRLVELIERVAAALEDVRQSLREASRVSHEAQRRA